MSATPTISVIIGAYTTDRWEDLTSAVASVQRQTLPPTEIIVVVDHNPTLLEMARAHFSDVRVVPNKEQRGTAGYRNTGISLASGAIIAFLDDDATAEPNWLEQLLPAYDDPAVIGVGGEILPRWPKDRPAWFPREFDWVLGCTYRGLPEQIQPVRNLIGANMSFRREAFDRVRANHGIGHVGGRPLGGSDPDICIRISRAFPNRKIVYTPAARVYHRVTPTRASWRYFRWRCYNEGLSKSMLTRLVGTRDSLSSERTYTLRTLPTGVLRGITDALHGDVGGLSRAGAIIAGLSITTAGYVFGSIQQRLPRSQRITKEVPA
jgi:glucosyl-dolichyl phosphate glucuronosyltransferase